MLSSLSRSPTLLEARAAAGSGGPEREREKLPVCGPGSVQRGGDGELTSSLRNCNFDSGEVHGFLIISASTLTDGL